MPKGNPKTSQTAKGNAKRKSVGRNVGKIQKVKEASQQSSQEHGNKKKQKEFLDPKKLVKKKLSFEEYNNKYKKKEENETNSKRRKTSEPQNKTSVKYVEDGDEVIFEVEGQGTDFASETEEDEQFDSTEVVETSDSDDGEAGLGSINNNAIDGARPGTSYQTEESDDEVQIKPRKQEEALQEEEQGMQ